MPSSFVSDLHVVLADKRCVAPGAGRCLGELQGAAIVTHGAEERLVHLDHHLAGFDLGIAVGQFLEAPAADAGHTCLIEHLLAYFHGRQGHDPLRELLVDVGCIVDGAARGNVLRPGIGEQEFELLAHQLHQGLPAGFREAGDRHDAVLARIEPVRGVARMLTADLGDVQLLAVQACRGADQVPGQGVLVEREEAVHHGNVDVLALARHFPVVERGVDRRGGVDRGNSVADRHGGDDRGLALVGPAAGALGDHVVARPVPVGTPVAEGRDRAVDDVGLDLLDPVIVQLQLAHDIGGEVFDEHVALPDELLDDLHPLGAFHVDADAAFPAVDVDRVRALRDAVFLDALGQPSLVGSGLVLLHLDDVGAQVGQRLCRVGSRQNPREIQYRYARQGTRFQFAHTCLPFLEL